jgi:hypothetical protein
MRTSTSCLANLRDITGAAFFCITRASICIRALKNCCTFGQVCSAKMHFLKFDVVAWRYWHQSYYLSPCNMRLCNSHLA